NVNCNSHNCYDITFDSDQIKTTITSSPYMVDHWISRILRFHRRRLHRLLVGLDVEWRPNFNRSRRNPAATLQLCVGRRCLIFQLIHAPEIPHSLLHFLGDETFTFVGVGIDQDARKLFDDYDLTVNNAVDLRSMAVDRTGRRDLRNAGLKDLAREILGREIAKPKAVTMSRWDDEYLTSAQVAYASIDAFLSFEIGRSLSS
ncbi:Werner Syndrome-like exonuclease, partial [Momordica charantia]|uniref:Werner Syndrome-like exonuclease n=1 Tax=Momordica charantia TaxID=3673 RepID=A0A6J1D121_MOMCH